MKNKSLLLLLSLFLNTGSSTVMNAQNGAAKEQLTEKMNGLWLKYLACEQSHKDCKNAKAKFENLLHEWQSKYATDDEQYTQAQNDLKDKIPHEGVRHYVIRTAQMIAKYLECLKENNCSPFISDSPCTACKQEELELTKIQAYVEHIPEEWTPLQKIR